ncbi:hypothetical protein BC628DRAFT_961524 [Trametes gibbosa]|nr:hypothetical protein BC628DRAFT_961524 [Trametes gibbosa]
MFMKPSQVSPSRANEGAHEETGQLFPGSPPRPPQQSCVHTAPDCTPTAMPVLTKPMHPSLQSPHPRSSISVSVWPPIALRLLHTPDMNWLHLPCL